MQRRVFLAFFGLVTLLALCGCHQLVKPSQISYPVALPSLIVERLSIVREVAWAKFNSGAPIHDPAREAVVLEEFVGQAVSHGADSDYARRFFSAQLEASRALQAEIIDGWRAGITPRPQHLPRDLKTHLRPRLDQITAHLATSLPRRDHPPFADYTIAELRKAGFSPAVIALAIGPLN